MLTQGRSTPRLVVGLRWRSLSGPAAPVAATTVTAFAEFRQASEVRRWRLGPHAAALDRRPLRGWDDSWIASSPRRPPGRPNALLPNVRYT